MSTGSGNNAAAANTATPPATNNPGANLNTPTTTINGTKKYGEPLFGPSIGSVSSGPGWTLAGEKKVMTDELTTDIVNGWIDKSKEPSNPTTTLQALVNLKRPTLRLSPLSSSLQEDVPITDHLHGLEFTYDCDAPKCGIYVYVHLTKDHPDAPPTQANLAKLQVFEIVQDGGFGNKLTIEDGAVLDLERFEYLNGVAVAGGSRDRQKAIGSEEKKLNSEGSLPIVSPGGGDSTSQLTGSAVDVTASRGNVATIESNNTGNHNSRRRFSNFHFRKLQLQRRVSGPALTVVDAERNAVSQVGTTPDGAKTPAASKIKDGDGVKVTIRLVSMDEQGMELESPNEQFIYLHIVREGTKADVPEEDTKPWVVKVVKREATIGPHTFHLHEIYGLSSAGSGTEPTPASHTYPPDTPGIPPSAEEDETLQSECLLCLSSPKEVVLLPCRHLVACKECALNMVEYGAGGNITYGTDPANAAEEGTGGVVAGGVNGGEGNVNGAGSVPTTTTTTPAAAIANARRKRKAKGWFCPICREPYTSMLRLTTTATSPPVLHDKGDADGSGSEDEGEVDHPTDHNNTGSGNSNSQGGSDSLVAGGTTGFFRSGFLRTLSGLGRERPGDVENQNQNQNQNPSSGA